MKKNNNKNQNNFFSQNIRKNGENFLDLKNSKTMQRDAPRIFREIARGNIDLLKYGHYFLDMQFLESLIVTANNEFIFHNISYAGVMNLIASATMHREQVDVAVTQVLETHKRRAEAYNIIFNYLTMLKNTRDLNYIYALANNLSPYKFDL